MAQCDACGSTILIGGVRDQDLRFCNSDCHGRGYLVQIARQIPRDVVVQQSTAVYHGRCPQCEGDGPVDVHTSYRVWSALLVTSWRSLPQISCKRCGVKSQLVSALYSLFLGWWGFPWGFVMTPVQIVRNVVGTVRRSPADGPSPGLEKMMSMLIAGQALEHHAQSTETE